MYRLRGGTVAPQDATPLRGDKLSADVGNPVSREPPAKPAEGTPLAMLAAAGGEVMSSDWSAYHLDAEARTYKNDRTPGLLNLSYAAASIQLGRRGSAATRAAVRAAWGASQEPQRNPRGNARAR